MNLLRFITAGSVDDGKSTLIGRLIVDTKSLQIDKLEQLITESKKNYFSNFDYSLITDGLKDEREQGITIDVAFMYFSTPIRRFIIADCPGHFQYTRNMITGASNSDLVIILIDAYRGVTDQSYRHAFISHLLGIKKAIVCINKIDLINYDQDVCNKIIGVVNEKFSRLSFTEIQYIPISALNGDNIISISNNTLWYQGPTLIEKLQGIEMCASNQNSPFRACVNSINRHNKLILGKYRSYGIKILGGSISRGEKVVIASSGFLMEIDKIFLGNKELDSATVSMNVVVLFKDELDINVGEILFKGSRPLNKKNVSGIFCWFSSTYLDINKKYIYRSLNSSQFCKFVHINHKIDICTYDEVQESKQEIKMNDIFCAEIGLTTSVFFEKYSLCKELGSFILVDPVTNETVACATIT